MKFGQRFEYYKIPEWFTDYVDYQKFKSLISSFKKRLRDGEVQKLRGLYYLTAQSSVNRLKIHEMQLAKRDSQYYKGESKDDMVVKKLSEIDQERNQPLLGGSLGKHGSSKDDSYLLQNDSSKQGKYFNNEDDRFEQRVIEQKLSKIIFGKGDHGQPGSGGESGRLRAQIPQPSTFKRIKHSQSDVHGSQLIGLINQPSSQVINASPSQSASKNDSDKAQLNDDFFDQDNAPCILGRYGKLASANQVIEVDFDLPKLDKALVDALKVVEADQQEASDEYVYQRDEAERDMRDWIDAFLQEIEKIENFYCSKLEEYSIEFEHYKEILIKKKYGHMKAYQEPKQRENNGNNGIQLTKVQSKPRVKGAEPVIMVDAQGNNSNNTQRSEVNKFMIKFKSNQSIYNQSII